jgi:isopentenyl diphosphate isomerase/L-lactate dehydrogenase-like FMN-dependent dehydrogenase
VFFQVHWSASRDVLLARAEAARAAGATALIVTLDWSFPGGRRYLRWFAGLAVLMWPGRP